MTVPPRGFVSFLSALANALAQILLFPVALWGLIRWKRAMDAEDADA